MNLWKRIKFWLRVDGIYQRQENGITYNVEIGANGIIWKLNGNIHRELGPAHLSRNRDVFWYQNDVLHRIEGPAAIYSYGTEIWYQHGQRHRADGPAVIESSFMRREWWYHGQQANVTSTPEFLQWIKVNH